MALAMPAAPALAYESGNPNPETWVSFRVKETIRADAYEGISGSIAVQEGSIAAGSKTLTLAASGDFRNGQGVAVTRAGGPCTLFNRPCSEIDSLAPTSITVVGAAGSETDCYRVSVVDFGWGVSRAGDPGCVIGAGRDKSSTNYNRIRIPRVTVAGAWPTGDALYLVYRSTTGSAGPYSLWGVAGPLGNDDKMIVDDIGAGQAVYDETWIPALNTAHDATGPAQQPLAAFAGLAPPEPPETDLNQWLLTTIVSGGGTRALTLADPAASSVGGQAVLHDDGPGIRELIGSARPGARILFGAHTYNCYSGVGNGAGALACLPINKSSIWLDGEGIGRTLIRAVPGNSWYSVVNPQGTPNQNQSHIAITNLSVDARAVNLNVATASAAVLLQYVDHVLLRKVEMANGSTQTLNLSDGSHQVWIDRCVGRGGWGDTFHQDCGGACPYDVAFTNNLIPVGGADVGGIVLVSTSATDTTHDVRVDRNRVVNAAIAFNDCYRCEASGNTVYANNKHINQLIGWWPGFGLNLSYNSGVNIHGNYIRKDVPGVNSIGTSPTSCAQLGDAVGLDNRAATAFAGLNLFHHNRVVCRDRVAIFSCGNWSAIYDNIVIDGNSGSDTGILYECRGGAPRRNLEMGNSFVGQAVGINAGSANAGQIESTFDDRFRRVARHVEGLSHMVRVGPQRLGALPN